MRNESRFYITLQAILQEQVMGTEVPEGDGFHSLRTLKLTNLIEDLHT